MTATQHSATQNVVDLMGAITGALKTTAGQSAGKLKKPEVVAALLKVLHSVVAAEEGGASEKKAAEISKAISGSYENDLDAIRAFVADKANGLQTQQ